MGLGKNGVDWEGMALHDRSRYMEIRKVLSTELDDNLVNMGDEELEYDFMDVVDSESTTLGSVELEMLKSNLMEMLSTLSDREAKILDMRFGLTGREHTLEECGHEFVVTRERIREIQIRALMKLRNPLRSEYIREYYSEMI